MIMRKNHFFIQKSIQYYNRADHGHKVEASVKYIIMWLFTRAVFLLSSWAAWSLNWPIDLASCFCFGTVFDSFQLSWNPNDFTRINQRAEIFRISRSRFKDLVIFQLNLVLSIKGAWLSRYIRWLCYDENAPSENTRITLALGWNLSWASSWRVQLLPSSDNFQSQSSNFNADFIIQ